MNIVIDNNGSKFEYNYFNNPIGYNNKSLKTFVLPASQNIYHFLYDFVGQILLIVKNENASQIKIIVTFHWDDDRSDNIILFLKNFFKKIQIDNYLIVKNNESFNDTDYYYVHECNPPSIAMHKEIYDAFMNAYPTEIKLPNKKVYLSRLKTDNPTNPMRPQRIDDEKKIEDFFIKNGFEIFCRSNFGETDIISDIKYFRDVSVLVGLSGAGLTNSIFMQPGNTIIEISVPLISHCQHEENFFPEKRILARHLFYGISSFIKNHLYIQIPCFDNSADNVINKIKNGPLYNIIRNDI